MGPEKVEEKMQTSSFSRWWLCGVFTLFAVSVFYPLPIDPIGGIISFGQGFFTFALTVALVLALGGDKVNRWAWIGGLLPVILDLVLAVAEGQWRQAWFPLLLIAIGWVPLFFVPGTARDTVKGAWNHLVFRRRASQPH